MMRFDTILYMEWAKQQAAYHNEDALNLADSGMPPPFALFREAGIELQNAPVSGDNLYGYLPLREAIAGRYSVQPEQVLTSQGTSAANFLLLAVLTGHGDKILVETPVYECLTGPAQSLGLEVIALQRQEENGWAFDPHEAAKKARDENAKGVLISNPHNPSGAFLDDDFITRFAEKIGPERFVIVDEVYREWLDNDRGKTVALKQPNIFVTSSLTKVWGLGHLRSGWAIATEDLVRKCYRAYDHIGVVQPFLMDWVSCRLMEKPGLIDNLRERYVTRLQAGRKLFEQFLYGWVSRQIHAVAPAGGGIAAVRFPGFDGETAVRQLRERYNVLVTPGGFFQLPTHVRLSWTGGEKVLAEALNRIREWIEEC